MVDLIARGVVKAVADMGIFLLIGLFVGIFIGARSERKHREKKSI